MFYDSGPTCDDFQGIFITFMIKKNCSQNLRNVNKPIILTVCPDEAPGTVRNPTDHGVNESKSGVVPSVTHYELMLIHI